MRATRDLLRRRMMFVRYRADLSAHVQNTVSQSGIFVGADIDAVGAISTAAVPLPAGMLLFVSGLPIIGLRAARKYSR
jgi:hypothetical protein